jgi:hypothetical protein
MRIKAAWIYIAGHRRSVYVGLACVRHRGIERVAGLELVQDTASELTGTRSGSPGSGKEAGGGQAKADPGGVRNMRTSAKSQKVVAIRKGKRNPEMDEADRRYEIFHGEPPEEEIEYEVETGEPEKLSSLGPLIELKVKLANGNTATLTDWDGTIAACTPDGESLYFLGDSQELNLKPLGLDGAKDHVIVGKLIHIVYEAKKKFDAFKLTQYKHKFREAYQGKKGIEPTLLYATRSQRLYVAGGTYKILAPGIVR